MLTLPRKIALDDDVPSLGEIKFYVHQLLGDNAEDQYRIPSLPAPEVMERGDWKWVDLPAGLDHWEVAEWKHGEVSRYQVRPCIWFHHRRAHPDDLLFGVGIDPRSEMYVVFRPRGVQEWMGHLE